MPQTTGRNHTLTGEQIGWWYLLVLVGAGALYVLTCAPAILWQDSGLLVYRIWHNDIEGNLGLALAHPLYMMVGIAVKYILSGDLAYRINLMSAVFGAVTIANLYLLVRLWLGKTLPALVSAITLAVSWTFFNDTATTEIYTLYTALLFGELILLLQYVRTKRIVYLYLLGLFNGLAIANHLWGAISLVCYTVFLVVLLTRRQIKLRHFGIAVVLWVIGAWPYEYVVIKNIIMSGDVAGTLSSAVFGNMWQNRVLNTSISLKMALENVAFVLLNFPTPNIVLLLVGLWALHKKAPSRSFANIIAAMLILYFLFALRYTVADRYVFFLPFYCLGAVLVGLGADIAFERHSRKSLALLVLAFALLPVPVYAVTPALARKVYKPLGRRRQRPYRDEYKYFLQPWKSGYRGAERFAREALDAVEENAIVYAYTTEVHALLYVQEVEGKRQDVGIISSFNSSADRPVLNEQTATSLVRNSALYVVSPVKGYCPAFLLERYDFVRQGLLWKVVER
jgi:hypothetical protein